VQHIGTHFISGHASAGPEVTPSDHLQTGWNLWLFGHQLAHLHAPWHDPYSFQPELSPRVDFPGLVFGLPYWPLFALFGAVTAWNLFTLATFVVAGGATCAWLRALELPRGAALVGGLVYALAPYRAAQSLDHLLGPISIFLPLALLALEKRRNWLAAAAIAAIPLSGQVSLALGAVPLFVAYAFVRGRGWRGALPGTVAAVAAAAVVDRYAIRGSIHVQGRSLTEVAHYSADWDDFLSRHGRGETFVFLGWLAPLLALAGFVLLLRSRRIGLALLLGAAVAIPVVAAVGTHLPTYRLARHVVPGLKIARVPERLMPIACLALAALVAFAVAEVGLVYTRPTRWRPAAGAFAIAALVVLLAADLHTRPAHAAHADEQNAAYEVARGNNPGRLLDLPVFLPDDQRNSAYLYYDMTSQRERPTGYSTTAPRAADSAARRLRHLNCGLWPADIRRYDIRYVAVHRNLFRYPYCAGRAERALRRHGFLPIARDGDVTMWSTAL
jgi:hypothetical protein